MHRLTSSTNAKGAATTLTYDNRGNLSTITSPKGNKTTYTYDALDRISKTLDPVGRVEEYTYDPVGNVTEITKNGGRAYTYTYDNVGNLTSAKNPMEQVQNFTYDSMNRLTSETDLVGKATSYTYDLNGQLTSVTDKNNALTAYTYDANGNITSITDPESRKISYTYDLLDRITNVTEGETQTAAYEYDSVGNLTKYIDGNNKSTTYTYNKLGEMTSITDPLGKVKEFSYNVNAMLDTVTNPDGSTVNYDYDVLDELITKRYDNEEDPQALYGYDADGNRISMDDVAGTTGYEYDEVGRITAVNLLNGKQIKYSYDEYGNISKLTYPDNTTVQYTYNELDQLTQIKDRQGKVTKYDRDANGSITKVTRPNNTYSTIEYDDMGNVIKVVNMGKNPYYNIEEELSTFAYTYDKSGFITGEAAKNGRRIEASQYEYDERGQLVKVSQTVTENNQFVEETEMVYTYDGAGNRLSAVKTSSGKILCNIQYTYNDNSQITDIESDCDDDKQTHIVLTYDENGNLKNTTCNDTEKVRDYTYDNENRLKAVKENGSLLMAALYDGNGDRIFRLDYRKNDEYVSNKAGTAENVYYPSGSVNSAYDTDVILNEMLIPNGVTNNTAINYELTGYINDINTEYTQTLMEFGANGNTTNIYEYGAQRNSATINGTKGYYLYDGRGSVAGLTGNTGGSMITYRYDAYGNTTKSNNTLNNPYQYNAEYTDSSTGLQYLRARYYDSSQGRFTAKDTYLGTIPNPLSRNLYTYVENNPLNYIDPSGHFAISTALAIIGIVSAVVTVGVAGYSTYKSVKNYNEQKAEVNQKKTDVAKNATSSYTPKNPVQNVAPKTGQTTGKFTYYDKREKKALVFTNAADYFAYKDLCDKLDEMEKQLAKDVTHNALDALGCIPGYGEIFDATNAVIYYAEGDYVNGTLSLVSCIPAAGDAIGKGSKSGKTVKNLAKATDTTTDAVKNTGKALDTTVNTVKNTEKTIDNTIDAAGNVFKGAKFSDEALRIAKQTGLDPSKVDDLLKNGYKFDANGRWHKPNGQFASNADVGIPSKPATPKPDPKPNVNNSSKPNQVHHFASDKNSVYTEQFKKITDKYGLDLDGAWNKESLPHQGRHPNDYHEFILDQLNDIDAIANGNQDVFLDLYEKRIKNIIKNNPDLLYSNGWK